MNLFDHEKSSLEKFGKPFTEVHQFLDSYYETYLGHAHRRLLHHRLGVELCVDKFGPEAREPAIAHIIEDVCSLPDNWSDYDEFFLPLGNEELQQRNDLISLYGIQVYETIESEIE